MTSEQYSKVRALGMCKYLPGSYQKRFIGDMTTKTIEHDLTEKQSIFIEKLYWQYRHQINKLRAKGWNFPEPQQLPETS